MRAAVGRADYVVSVVSKDYEKGYAAGLQDGSCRFDCRKEKVAFKTGWNMNGHDLLQHSYGTGKYQVWSDAYKDWKNAS